MPEPHVRVSAVEKTYPGGISALRGVDLEIGLGLFGLLGPNGAGKTTLLRIMATLLKPTSGTVTVGEWDSVKDRERIRARLGYLPQEFGLYPRLTAAEHVRYFCRLRGLKGSAADDETDRVLKLVGLSDVAGRQARRLSGGMRQRVGVAIALAGTPDLLVVDEPTVGLDPEERVRFRNMLADLAQHSAVVLSTHIVADIESGCAHAAIIADGRVLAAGTPEQLSAEAAGRVWNVEVDRAGVEEMRRRYAVMAQREGDDGRILLRVAATEQPPGATSLEPRLEDAYMLLTRAQTGDAA
jgi:ABC-2 type transport system ATP-binding protein